MCAEGEEMALFCSALSEGDKDVECEGEELEMLSAMLVRRGWRNCE
jgi:hypothetical protein